jgi:uncharacterized cupredoxin-like copper-binding protein
MSKGVLLSVRTTIATLSATALAALGGLALTAAPAGAATKTVTAVETEFHIKLSQTSFKPGKYTFLAENKGKVTHALEITGPGLKSPTTKDLSPGQSAKLTVTFKKGKYDVFCPVPGHKMLGMNVNLVIASSGGTTTASKSTSTASTAGGGVSY